MQQLLQIPDIHTTTQQQIVIVENDLGLSHAIEQMLQAAGYDTCTFISAAALLDCAETVHADCFLLSMDLPGMSGIELRKQLSAQGKLSPVVFMTTDDLPAYCEPHLKERFLHKPFRGYRLVTAIRTALNFD